MDDQPVSASDSDAAKEGRKLRKEGLEQKLICQGNYIDRKTMIILIITASAKQSLPYYGFEASMLSRIMNYEVKENPWRTIHDWGSVKEKR